MPADRVVVAVLGLTLLSGCAAGPSGPPQPPANADVSTGQDCAVFAAIAREHYRFAENPPPPLWDTLEEADGGRYFVQCDWPRLGVPITGQVYDPDNPRMGWVKFERPRYLGQRALVATEVMRAPLAGTGYECEVVSGVTGWTVAQCRHAWVS